MTARKTLLLSCCAPCSCAVLEKLAKERDLTVFFYNPNIYPLSEYEKRRDEQRGVCDRLQIPFVELPYEPEAWRQAVKGLEAEPERGRRCEACFLLRLQKAAAYAYANGFEDFTSVLGVSRYKDLEQVNRAASQAALENGAAYDGANWRKGGLEERRRALLKEWALYNQNYCGCIYSFEGKANENTQRDTKKNR